MKVTLLTFILGFFLSTSLAQNCDIAQAGVAIYDATNTAPVTLIATGQNANFKFSISNVGISLGCAIPANSVTAVLDFPKLATGIRPYIYVGPSSFVSGYFTWTYNNLEEVLEGTNTLAIPGGSGDMDILVKVKGNAIGAGYSNLNITQGKGISDNTGNNFSRAQLIVSAPVPVKLSSFTVVPDKCDALLNWSTLSEINFSHFDIEYSPDAITFIKIGTVQGRNISTGSDYKFSYTQLSGNGYYRLKLVDKDGRFEYSDVARIKTTCTDQGKILVYPNPLRYDQKLIVNISGYQGKISGELFNVDGQRLNAYNLVNSTNELSVKNLSAGVYMLYVKADDGGDTQSFKIIITR